MEELYAICELLIVYGTDFYSDLELKQIIMTFFLFLGHMFSKSFWIYKVSLEI